MRQHLLARSPWPDHRPRRPPAATCRWRSPGLRSRSARTCSQQGRSHLCRPARRLERNATARTAQSHAWGMHERHPTAVRSPPPASKQSSTHQSQVRTVRSCAPCAGVHAVITKAAVGVGAGLARIGGLIQPVAVRAALAFVGCCFACDACESRRQQGLRSCLGAARAGDVAAPRRPPAAHLQHTESARRVACADGIKLQRRRLCRGLRLSPRPIKALPRAPTYSVGRCTAGTHPSQNPGSDRGSQSTALALRTSCSPCRMACCVGGWARGRKHGTHGGGARPHTLRQQCTQKPFQASCPWPCAHHRPVRGSG